MIKLRLVSKSVARAMGREVHAVRLTQSSERLYDVKTQGLACCIAQPRTGEHAAIVKSQQKSHKYLPYLDCQAGNARWSCRTQLQLQHCVMLRAKN